MGFLWTQFNMHTHRQAERASSFFAGKPCDLFIHSFPFLCLCSSFFWEWFLQGKQRFCNFVRREMNVFLTFLGNLFIPWNSQTRFLFLFSFKFPSFFVTIIWKTWWIYIIHTYFNSRDNSFWKSVSIFFSTFVHILFLLIYMLNSLFLIWLNFD